MKNRVLRQDVCLETALLTVQFHNVHYCEPAHHCPVLHCPCKWYCYYWLFVGDVSVAATGCGGRLVARDLESVLTSPGYPNHYTNNLMCRWYISAPPGKRISIRFTDLNVEGHSGSCIFLFLFDGCLVGCALIPLVGRPEGHPACRKPAEVTLETLWLRCLEEKSL